MNTPLEKQLAELKMHRERIFWKQRPEIKGLDVREVYDADYVDALLSRLQSETEKRVRGETITEVLKIIDDNDPQTHNKVNPRYWGATLRKDIAALSPTINQ